MTEESKGKIEDIVNEIFTKGSHKALIARDILTKYKGTGSETSKEYREELIEKYMQSKDTPEKSRRRTADVFSKLRKAGRYEDAYTRGERTAVGKKKTPLEKTPSTTTPIIPSTVPSILPSVVPSTVPSTPSIQETMEGDIKNTVVSTPSKRELYEAFKKELFSQLNKSSIEKLADELNVDPADLKVFIEAKSKEKTTTLSRMR